MEKNDLDRFVEETISLMPAVHSQARLTFASRTYNTLMHCARSCSVEDILKEYGQLVAWSEDMKDVAVRALGLGQITESELLQMFGRFNDFIANQIPEKLETALIEQCDFKKR